MDVVDRNCLSNLMGNIYIKNSFLRKMLGAVCTKYTLILI